MTLEVVAYEVLGPVPIITMTVQRRAML
jgi:hypothetical protein